MLSSPDSRLRTILRLNSLSCVVFGSLFAFEPNHVSHFLVNSSSLAQWVFWIGIVLIGNGVHLIAGSVRRTTKPLEVGYFIVGDALWVVFSTVFLTTDWVDFGPQARLAIGGVGLWVGLLGVLQWMYFVKVKSN